MAVTRVNKIHFLTLFVLWICNSQWLTCLAVLKCIRQKSSGTSRVHGLCGTFHPSIHPYTHLICSGLQGTGSPFQAAESTRLAYALDGILVCYRAHTHTHTYRQFKYLNACHWTLGGNTQHGQNMQTPNSQNRGGIPNATHWANIYFSSIKYRCIIKYV